MQEPGKKRVLLVESASDETRRSEIGGDSTRVDGSEVVW